MSDILLIHLAKLQHLQLNFALFLVVKKAGSYCGEGEEITRCQAYLLDISIDVAAEAL